MVRAATRPGSGEVLSERYIAWLACGARGLVLGVALLYSTIASAQNVGDPCGALTYVGECAGDTVRWCNESGVVDALDCADATDGYGPNATCGLWDCTSTAADCYGYWCVGRQGQACDYGSNLACDVTSGLGCLDWVCAPSVTCDPASYSDSCNGDVVSWCPVPRVWNVDCRAGGADPYTCAANSQGEVLCLGLAGGECDPLVGFECVAGLTCSNGFCVGQDAGVGTDSARPDSARPDSSRPDTSTGPDRALRDTSSGRDTSVGPDRGLGTDSASPPDIGARDLTRADVVRIDSGAVAPGRDAGAASEPTDYVATAGCACDAAGLPASLFTALALLSRLVRRARRRSS